MPDPRPRAALANIPDTTTILRHAIRKARPVYAHKPDSRKIIGYKLPKREFERLRRRVEMADQQNVEGLQ